MHRVGFGLHRARVFPASTPGSWRERRDPYIVRSVSMSRDSASSRARILAAAVGQLRHGGRDDCTVEAISLSAKCAKGLVLYHFGSKETLLARAAHAVRQDRWARLAAALTTRPGLDGWESLWGQLLEQQRDGTAGAHLSLIGIGEGESETDQTFSSAVLRWLRSSGVRRAAPDAALAARAAVDGFSIALTARISEDDLAVAFLALGLALVVAAEGRMA